MTQKTYITPEKSVFGALKKLPTDQSVHMLNMLQFKAKAEYDQACEFADKDWTGERAYIEYSKYAGPIIEKLGGSVIYMAQPQLTVIGPDFEDWNSVFIVQYPNIDAFLALINDPEYQQNSFHRDAALSDSRLVRMTPPDKT